MRPLYGYDLLHYGALALADVEANGIRIDLDRANKLMDKLDQEIIEILDEIRATRENRLWRDKYGRDVDINSSKQLSELLFKVCGYEPKVLTATGNPSVNAEALFLLNIEFTKLIERYRKLTKAKDTYLKNIIMETSDDGFLHPFFHLHLVRTYRSSSSNINFQNIPKRDKEIMKMIRSLFIPRKGHRIVEIDYSGMEVRVAACYNKDPNLIAYLKDKTKDMHRDTASDIFKLPISKINKSIRFVAKNNFVFAEFYGDYYKNCAEQIWNVIENEQTAMDDGTLIIDHLRKKKIDSLDIFTEHLLEVENVFWNERFPVYAQWKNDFYREYLKNGFIKTLTGFYLRGYMHRNKVINYPVQGSAFHILLFSLIILNAYLKKKKLKTKIIGQIHDSIVLDVPANEFDFILELSHKILTELVPGLWDWIIVPLEVEVEATEIDQPWSEKKLIA